MYFAAKFNGKVPGTVNHTPDSEHTQNLITTVDESSTETTTANVTLQSSSPMPTMSAASKESGMTNNIQRLALEIGSPLFYGLVAAGSVIILILLLCVIGVSILACTRRGSKCVYY